MFVGSQFCPHCGTKAAVPLDVGPALSCPDCRVPMEQVLLKATPLQECRRCYGIWVGIQAFDRICADGERQADVLAAQQPPVPYKIVPSSVRYRPCPQCGQLMNRFNFSQPAASSSTSARPTVSGLTGMSCDVSSSSSSRAGWTFRTSGSCRNKLKRSETWRRSAASIQSAIHSRRTGQTSFAVLPGAGQAVGLTVVSIAEDSIAVIFATVTFAVGDRRPRCPWGSVRQVGSSLPGRRLCCRSDRKRRSGNRRTAWRSDCSHRTRIFIKSGSFSAKRRCRVMFNSSARIRQQSIGGPTVTLDFIVESSESSAYLAASSSVVFS